MSYFLCGTFQWRKFPFLLISLTRSTLRSSLLAKCHLNSPLISKNSRFTNLSVYTLLILPPFQYEKGFIKGEALRLLRTNSIKENFYKHKRDFEQRLCNRGYLAALVHKILTEVQFSDRTEALRYKTKKAKEILPLVTTYNLATPNLRKILMKNWHIIQQQPILAHIFKQPPILSYRKEKSLKDSLARAKLPSITPQSSKLVNKEAIKLEGNLDMIFC